MKNLLRGTDYSTNACLDLIDLTLLKEYRRLGYFIKPYSSKSKLKKKRAILYLISY
jgi:hypothetical protein